MKNLPQALSSLQEFLNELPCAVWIIKKEDLTIQWANNHAFNKTALDEKQLLNQPLNSVLTFSEGFKDKDLAKELEKYDNRELIAFLNPLHRAVNGKTTTHTLTGERCSIKIISKAAHFILYIQQKESSLLRKFFPDTDFIISTYENGKIKEISPNFYLYSALRGNFFHGKDITAFIPKPLFKRIQDKKKEAMDYIHSYFQTADTAWKPLFKETFKDSRRIEFGQYASSWEVVSDKGLVYRVPDSAGYVYFKDKLNLKNRDLSISVSVMQEKLSRFAILFNQKRPTEWDLTGYNFGINLNRGKPFLTLKKNTRFVFYRPLEIPADNKFTLKVDKIGGLFVFYVNGEKIAAHADITPISNQYGAFGLLSSGLNTFTRLEASTRESQFDESRIFTSLRAELPFMQGRVFEIEMTPMEDWAGRSFPVIRDAYLFRDVTEIARIEQDRDYLSQQNRLLKSKNYFGFVGGNSNIIEMLDKVSTIADTNASVLIHGLTGSGKAVLARAIHMGSNRTKGPFVKVDCATLPQSLMESELFGHEKGAFTGALDRHIGKFEAADGGTLFLDEIGNLDVSTQAKLLGFLEDHTFTRIGSNDLIKVNTRIIAATNSPLAEMVEAGLFREDLYFRLKVILIELPALKDRLDDIPLLAEHFLKEINAKHKTNITGLSKQVLETLMFHEWPGNVRELFNVLVNLAVQKKEGVIECKPDFRETPKGQPSRRTFVPEKVRHETLIKFSANTDFFSARDCLRVLPVSLPTIQRDLQKLIKSRKLKSHGKGPSVRYARV